MSLSPGAKLGSYEIIAPLGAGGMGEVYRARDPQLARDVAIKILPASLTRDPDRLRRFEQEARAAAALNHPNILAVFQFGNHEGAPYLVSELLEGSTLRDQLSRGPVPIRKAVDYATQTARGLAAAHEKGIVHRDLKPENLFLTKDGRIKILDFGLAKLIPQPHASEPGSPTLTEGTEPGVVLGTVGYMSPEQVRGQTTDNRTDLFALGAILYELITGKRAFHKPTSPETMTAILNEDPPSASQIAPGTPPGLRRVVQRCLEKTPEQRFHSASDLAFALEALSDSGSSISATHAARGESRRIWWLLAAAGIALAALAAAGFWFTRPPAVPVIESVVRLTNDPKAKSGTMETDGTRIYFTEGSPGSLKLAQVSVNGGQIADLVTPLNNPQVASLAPDGSELLALVSPYIQQANQMWAIPLPAGEPRRLSDAMVTDAAFFPDGHLIYATNTSFFTAEKDGANPRKVDGLPGFYAPAISLDGKHFAFSTYDNASKVGIISESLSDGTGMHEVLRGGAKGIPEDVCCPRWTADGKFLIFSAKSEQGYDLWAIAAHTSALHSETSATRLTNGPLSFTDFVAGRDGKQMFAIGSQPRGELVRFDSRLHDFVPFLEGISALDPTFSRDGRWVTYISYPERTLWRSRPDGSERLQLTYPPLYVSFARISPDGTQVAVSDGNGIAYEMSASGGTPRQLGDHATAPDWSPDGATLAVTSWISDKSLPDRGQFQLETIDVKSGKITPVPNSQKKIGPWFVSPTAFVAVTQDQTKFQLFDLKTQQWTDFITSPGDFITWETSPDGKYFLYATGGNDSKVFRMKLADRTIEEITSLKNFVSINSPALSVSPDNSPVLTRNVGTQEIYALKVKWP